MALQWAQGRGSQNCWEHLWGRLGCRLFAPSVFGDIVLHLSVKPLPGPLWSKGRNKAKGILGRGWLVPAVVPICRSVTEEGVTCSHLCTNAMCISPRLP